MLSMDLLALAAAPKFRDLVTPSILPARKAQIQWNLACQQPFAMDGNDQYGDCFWAMATYGPNMDGPKRRIMEFVPSRRIRSRPLGLHWIRPNDRTTTKEPVERQSEIPAKHGIAGKSLALGFPFALTFPDEMRSPSTCSAASRRSFGSARARTGTVLGRKLNARRSSAIVGLRFCGIDMGAGRRCSARNLGQRPVHGHPGRPPAPTDNNLQTS